MKYTVVWTSSAEREFAERELVKLWMHADPRQAVADAADQIERELAGGPYRVGFELNEDYREVLVPPLSFLYRVRDEDRIVTVIFVRQLRDEPQ